MPPSAPSKPVIAVFVGNEGVEAAGSKTVEHLYKAAGDAVHIRVVVRKATHAKPEWSKWGCEVLTHDVRRPGAEKIFKDDCNAAFWATPISEDRVALTEKFLQSCIENGIDFPVVMSGFGAGGPTVHLTAFAGVEAACKKLAGTKVKEQFWDKGKQQLQPIVLRAGLFYESLYAFLPTLKQGHLYLPMPADGRAPWVSLEDVGAVAAEILVRPDKWADKTLEISAGLFSGGDVARSLTMHGREGGVKFEPIDTAVSAAALAKAGLAQWVARADTELIAHYSIACDEDDFKSDVEAVLGRKPTPVAKFAKAIKPHIQPDTPVEVPSFVKALAAGGKKKKTAAAAAAADGGDGGEPVNAEVAAAAARAARDTSILVSMTMPVTDKDGLQAALDALIREAEGGSPIQMAEFFVSRHGGDRLRVHARHGSAEEFAAHAKAVADAIASLNKCLGDLPDLEVCGAVTPVLSAALKASPASPSVATFKRFAGFTTYKFSSNGVPQGRRHGTMFACVATVREDKLDELKQCVVGQLVPLLESAKPPPLMHEWFVSGDGTKVAWHEKHANAADAAAAASKAAATMRTIAEDFVVMPDELILEGNVSAELLDALAPFNPVVFDKAAGFTRFEF